MAEKSESDKQRESNTIAETTRETLPHDLVVYILSRLPAIYLVPLRFVCKSWYELITRDPKFAKSVLDRSLQIKSDPISMIAWEKEARYNHTTSRVYVDAYMVTDHTDCNKVIKLDLPFLDPELSTRASSIYSICNGMLCTADENKHEIYIWNPLTNYHITIPYPSIPVQERYPGFMGMTTVFGFGYVESVNEYKIVRLDGELFRLDGEHDFGRCGYITHISFYTLGVDSDWRTCGCLPCEISFNGVPCPQTDGRLHWLAKTDDGMFNNAVLSFDLRDELFYQINLPPIDFTSELTWVSVQKLRGLLCLIKANYSKQVEIHVLRNDRRELFWCLEHTIGRPEVVGDFSVLLPLIEVADNACIIIWKDPKELITYNLITKAINHINGFGFPIMNPQAFVGSLVSPRAINGSRSLGT